MRSSDTHDLRAFQRKWALDLQRTQRRQRRAMAATFALVAMALLMAWKLLT